MGESKGKTTVMMTYQQAIDYIHSANRFGIKLGLENTRKLLAELGDPQASLRFIHIAGTNGKGSTASFIAHALMAAGYRVGRYISPYIEVFNERMQIDNDYIADADLVKHTAKVKAAAEKLAAEGVQPTEFEIVTAIGLLYFAERAVDVVVLEVGMGGRFDSTNVIDVPLAAVITPVSLDHMAYLGDTIEAIAFEKAGIIKAGGLVISSQSDARASKVIEDICTERGAHYAKSDWQLATNVNYGEQATTFSYCGASYRIGMFGTFQLQNACTAIDALQALAAKGVLEVPQSAIAKGLKRATWRGRFEVIHRDPTLIIDGAHNVDAVSKFIESLNHYDQGRRRIAIFGILADKAVDDIVRLIVPEFDCFYLVKPDNPRAVDVAELANKIRQCGFKGDIITDQSLQSIAKTIAGDSANNNLYCAFGSLYYIGELRKRFKN